MASKPLAGTAYFTLNGKSYRLVGELEWSSCDTENTTENGMDGIHGFSQKYSAPFVSGKFRDSDDINVKDLNGTVDGALVCELANGKTVTGSDMWTVNKPTVNSEDGTFPLRFEGVEGSVVEMQGAAS